MKVASAIYRAARERVLYPIVGRVLDRGLRWLRAQDGWEHIVSVSAHVLVEQSTAVGARTLVADVIRDVGRYLGPESVEVLRRIDDITKNHSSEAN